MKKLTALLLMMILVVSLAGCNKYNSFSYEEEYEKICKDPVGVKHGGFVNTSKVEIVTDKDALERAKKECTIKWDSSDVYYDYDLKIWWVHFYTEGLLGGDQSVYLNEDGKTILTVSGE